MMFGWEMSEEIVIPCSMKDIALIRKFGVHRFRLTQEFWNFSYDDFAAKDMPKTIDYIIEHSKYEKVSYIGHSQGTQQMFIGFFFGSI